VLWGVFAVFTLGSSTRPITPQEAFIHWAIADEARAQPPVGTRNALNALGADVARVGTQLGSVGAGGLGALGIHGQNVWAWGVGDSLFALRTYTLMGWLVLLAWVLLSLFTVQAQKRIKPARAIARLLAVILATALTWQGTPDLALPNADWQTPARLASIERPPQEPLIYAIPPAHPFAYEAKQAGLLRGYALNVGWKAWDEDTLADVYSRFDHAPVIWLAGNEGDAALQVARARWQSTHTPTYEARTEGMVILRLARE
jgi:hypothetical protein